MSVEAAKVFDISQGDLLKFLNQQKQPEVVHPAVSDQSKHVILVVSIFLFVLALVTCGCTLCLWFVSKRKKDGEYSKLKDEPEKGQFACDQNAVKDTVKGTPTLPQMTEKPKLDQSTPFVAEPDILAEDELSKLRVKNIDVDSSFYVHRNRIRINVKEVELAAVDEKLSQNAFVYVVIGLLPEKSAFFESDLRPVAEMNYFDQAAEFDCEAAEIETRTLKVAVYACDRFSQHRLVNEYTYNLSVPEDIAVSPSSESEGDEDQETKPKPSLVPVELNELSRSADHEQQSDSPKEGEILFSLCYMPTSGRLTFVALKGRNISDDEEVPLATYLRVSLLILGKSMKTVQTSSVRRSTAPVYNEAFVFHTPLERIKETDIVVSVMTYGDTAGQSKSLGKVVVGPKSENNLGRKHWEAMLSSPRKPVAQWHALESEDNHQ